MQKSRNSSRRFCAFLVLVAGFGLLQACSDAGTTSANGDTSAPTVKLSAAGATADSLVAFSVAVNDNLGIKTIHVGVSGGLSKSFDTTFTTANTSVLIPFSLLAPKGVAKGTPVVVIASAVDGAGNKSNVDTLNLTVGNLAPPLVVVTSPAAGTNAVLGKSIVVSVSGKSAARIRSLGLFTSGAVTRADSVTFSSPLRDSTSVQDTIAIPISATAGPLVITPFLVDSLGTRTTGPAVTITVLTAAAANTTPSVSVGITPRIEVSDTIHVEANDAAGIVALGYEVRTTPGGALTSADSIISSGALTSQIKTFTMRLPITTFPTTVYVQGFARNANGVRSYAKIGGGVDRVDTVTIVAGVTRPLPFGGVVADAIYHAGKDRLYLTNISRNQVEVFSLTDSSFKSAVNVGSRPWGIALWPRNRSGAVGDTLLVANSGGTDISYINLNGSGSGTEVNRYALPNIIAYSITTVQSQTSTLQIQQRTKYDFSDRPQFIGAVCADAGGGACGDVVVTYTTTPTPGQSMPFTSRNGTVRSENLAKKTSHFFFEQAIGQTAGRGDTLEIVRYDANTGDSTVLLPYKQTVGSGSTARTISTIVKIPDLAFRDTTFLRNSGNFLRSVIGEGGAIFGSRALIYDVSKGLETTAPDGAGVLQPLPVPYRDKGVSDAASASDFTANTFQQITGVGINFDGSLAGIRGDSTYIINQNLRLQGTLATSLANAGFDFHPSNTGPNSFPLITRLAFAASAQPLIAIFDTHCYQLVGTIPIRDPIVGPIRAALRPLTGQLVLVAATARGVVIATLPNTFTTSCP